MIDFRLSRPLVIGVRIIFAAIGGFALVASYLGFSASGTLSPLEVLALGAVGAALLALAVFGPPKWCAAVLWFCQW